MAQSDGVDVAITVLGGLNDFAVVAVGEIDRVQNGRADEETMDTGAVKTVLGVSPSGPPAVATAVQGLGVEENPCRSLEMGVSL